MAEINERALEAAKKAACDAHPLGNRIDDALWIGRAVDAAILAYESALLNPASSAAGKNMLTHSEIEPDGRTEEAHRNIDQEGGGSRRRERRDEILASSGERSERALCAEHRDTAEVNATTPRGSGPEALSAQGKDTGWFRIDDPENPAPKDGTPIDLWHSRVGRIVDVRWWEYRPEHFAWMRDSDIYSGTPLDDRHFTHWRPRPAPPSREG